MNREYFNNAAKWGLLLGVILGISRIYESNVMMSGSMSQFATVTIEWFVVTIIYIYILYRASKQQAAIADPQFGYPFRQALNYSILISAFAGVIIGVLSHIYVTNVVGGYDIYTMKSIESVTNVLNEANVESGIKEMYNNGLDSVKSMGENPPSIFSTTLSIVANYIISGFLIGLFVAYKTKRAPEITSINENKEDSDE